MWDVVFTSELMDSDRTYTDGPQCVKGHKKEKHTHKTALTSCHNNEIERKKENNKRKLRMEL